MKSLAELRTLATEALENTVEYEVETNLDTDGGYYFSDLNNAYIYLARTLKRQTDVEFLECADFEKIDYIRVAMHFVDIDKDIIPLVGYARKSDTEFHETVLF